MIIEIKLPKRPKSPTRLIRIPLVTNSKRAPSLNGFPHSFASFIVKLLVKLPVKLPAKRPVRLPEVTVTSIISRSALARTTLFFLFLRRLLGFTSSCFFFFKSLLFFCLNLLASVFLKSTFPLFFLHYLRYNFTVIYCIYASISSVRSYSNRNNFLTKGSSLSNPSKVRYLSDPFGRNSNFTINEFPCRPAIVLNRTTFRADLHYLLNLCDVTSVIQKMAIAIEFGKLNASYYS